MPLELEALKRKYRKEGKSVAQAEKLATEAYYAKHPKTVEPKKKAKKGTKK